MPTKWAQARHRYEQRHGERLVSAIVSGLAAKIDGPAPPRIRAAAMSSNATGFAPIRRRRRDSTGWWSPGTPPRPYPRRVIGRLARCGVRLASISISARCFVSGWNRRICAGRSSDCINSTGLIEQTELNRTLAQDLYQTRHLRAITLRPEGDNLARLLAQAARFEAGQVHLPENAPWARDLFERTLGISQCAA